MVKSKFDPQKHHRRSIRLPGYDYSQPGAYNVTVVTWHRECLFGQVVDGEMRLNNVGKIVQSEWLELSKRLWKIPSLKGTPIWQRNYYEHIIRNEKDLQNKTDYQ
jgi:hypothetical protein